MASEREMTTKELIGKMCDVSDEGGQHVGVYVPDLVKATRNKKGVTTLTFVVRTGEFTPDDALRGLVRYLALSTITAAKKLQGSAADGE